ncbi:11772_t:CDS:1, partial [Dentiscutata heterogama]
QMERAQNPGPCCVCPPNLLMNQETIRYRKVTSLAMKKLVENGFKLAESDETRYLCHSCYSNMVVNPVNKRKWKEEKHMKISTTKQTKRTVYQSHSIGNHNTSSTTITLDNHMLVPKGEYKKL